MNKSINNWNRKRSVPLLFAFLLLAFLFSFAKAETVMTDEKSLHEIQGSTDPFKISLIYYKGEGVTKDYKKAFEWFSQSAEQGNSDAQALLGIQYSSGNGISLNKVYALK